MKSIRRYAILLFVVLLLFVNNAFVVFANKDDVATISIVDCAEDDQNNEQLEEILDVQDKIEISTMSDADENEDDIDEEINVSEYVEEPESDIENDIASQSEVLTEDDSNLDEIDENDNINKIKKIENKLFGSSAVGDVYYKLVGNYLYLTSQNKAGYTKGYSYLDEGWETIREITIEDVICPEGSCAMWFNYDYLNKINNLDYLNTENVTSMMGMFGCCDLSGNLDLTTFDTRNVKDFSDMFLECHSLTSIDLSSFDTHNAEDMTEMFLYLKKLKTIYVSEDFIVPSKADDMFGLCRELVGGNGTTYNDSQNPRIDKPGEPGLFTAKDKTVIEQKDDEVYCRQEDEILYMSHYKKEFYKEFDPLLIKRSSITTIIIEDLLRPKSCKGWFGNFEKLNKIENIEKLDTKNVTDMSSMFYNSAFEKLDLSTFDTSSVETMYSMFSGCKKLKTLDLSSFNTEKLTRSGYMFSGDELLETIYASENFVTIKIYSDTNMWKGCDNITGGNGTKFQGNVSGGKKYACIDNDSNIGYFTLKKVDDEEKETEEIVVDIVENDKNENKNSATVKVDNNEKTNNYSNDRSSGNSGGGGSSGGNATAKVIDSTQPVDSTQPIMQTQDAPPKQSDAKTVSFNNDNISVSLESVSWAFDPVSNAWSLNPNALDTSTKATNGIYTLTSLDANGNAVNDSYCFDAEGHMMTGWVKDSVGNTYFFNNTQDANIGKMTTGWKEIGTGEWYCFSGDGKLITNGVTADGYTVDAEGKWIK